MQRAVAEFIRDGHQLRHLRRMKRLYAARHGALMQHLGNAVGGPGLVEPMMGLGVVLRLPDDAPDVEIARQALPFGLAPVPLSMFYSGLEVRKGLLLGATNVVEARLATDCIRLLKLVRASAGASQPGTVRAVP